MDRLIHHGYVVERRKAGTNSPSYWNDMNWGIDLEEAYVYQTVRGTDNSDSFPRFDAPNIVLEPDMTYRVLKASLMLTESECDCCDPIEHAVLGHV